MYEDHEAHYFETHENDGQNCSSSSQLMESAGNYNTTFILDDLSSTHHHHHHHHHHNNNSINPSDEAAGTMDFELEQAFNTHLMQEALHDPNSTEPTAFEQTNWDSEVVVQEMKEMSSTQQQEEAQFYHHQQQQIELQHNLQCFNSLYPQTTTPTPDLLNLLHLPRCSVSSMLPNSSISFTNPDIKSGNFHNSLDIFGNQLPEGENGSGSSMLYDHPSLHLNIPPQPPIFRDLFHSLPHNFNFTAGGSSSALFGGGLDDRLSEGMGVGVGVGGGGGGVSNHQVDTGLGDGTSVQFENSVLDFRMREMNNSAGVRKNRGGATAHFTTEKQRRVQFKQMYTVLRNLVANPTKPDRASVVGDAIEYIKELRRTVDELKILVDKKRCGRNKKLKTEDPDQAGGTNGDMESYSTLKPSTDREQTFNGSLRSSWLQRKSKETEVDVRIIDDEVTIKLIQRKRMNCLLSVSKILDELQLDLLHVSGGNIGDYYSFLFNTKIYEGSTVYASAIAEKVIEGVDKQYTVATVPVAATVFTPINY